MISYMTWIHHILLNGHGLAYYLMDLQFIVLVAMLFHTSEHGYVHLYVHLGEESHLMAGHPTFSLHRVGFCDICNLKGSHLIFHLPGFLKYLLS